MALLFEEIPIKGTPPNPRFGHTITPVSREKVCLFGGATEERFQITNDTFLLDLTLMSWTKLESKVTRLSFGFILLSIVSFHNLSKNGVAFVHFVHFPKCKWELDTGAIPCARAAHSMVQIDEKTLALFGGATGSTLDNKTQALISLSFWRNE